MLISSNRSGNNKMTPGRKGLGINTRIHCQCNPKEDVFAAAIGKYFKRIIWSQTVPICSIKLLFSGDKSISNTAYPHFMEYLKQ